MKTFAKILGFLLIIFAAVIGWGWSEYQKELLKPVVNQAFLFKVNRGDSVNKIIKNLQSQQVDVNYYWFKTFVFEKKLRPKLKAGDYRLSKGLTMPKLIFLLTKGKTQQRSITFPEGWSFKQMRQRLANTPYLKHTLAGMDNETIMAKLNSDYKHPEGLFFPATYFFNNNSSDFDILKKSYKKMEQVLKQQWKNKESNLLLKSPYETLILASIIEKETAAVEERTLISGVFSRRLKIGMRLQTDPTVIYGMGERYNGKIRYKDLREATAYNTYVIKGLPPTPIAMPGKEAIYAALHPAKGKSLYFVSRNNGTHVFSATLAEHNKAVDYYQRGGNKK